MPDPTLLQNSCTSASSSSSSSSLLVLPVPRCIPEKYLVRAPQRVTLSIPVSAAVAVATWPSNVSKVSNVNANVNESVRDETDSGVCASNTVPTETVLEYSIHVVPSLMRRELAAVVCGDDANIKSSTLPLLCIATWQKSCMGLIQATPNAQRERNRLLETFYGWGKYLAKWIRGHRRANANVNASGNAAVGDAGFSVGVDNERRVHYWADLIDPCTGSVTLGRPSGGIYSEVEGMAMLLRYRVQQAGFCHVVLHPAWHDHAYPASIFTDAPLELVEQAIHHANHHFGLDHSHNNSAPNIVNPSATPSSTLCTSSYSSSLASSSCAFASLSLGSLSKEEEQLLKLKDELSIRNEKHHSLTSASQADSPKSSYSSFISRTASVSASASAIPLALPSSSSPASASSSSAEACYNSDHYDSHKEIAVKESSHRSRSPSHSHSHDHSNVGECGSGSSSSGGAAASSSSACDSCHLLSKLSLTPIHLRSYTKPAIAK